MVTAPELQCWRLLAQDDSADVTASKSQHWRSVPVHGSAVGQDLKKNLCGTFVNPEQNLNNAIFGLFLFLFSFVFELFFLNLWCVIQT